MAVGYTKDGTVGRAGIESRGQSDPPGARRSLKSKGRGLLASGLALTVGAGVLALSGRLPPVRPRPRRPA